MFDIVIRRKRIKADEDGEETDSTALKLYALSVHF